MMKNKKIVANTDGGFMTLQTLHDRLLCGQWTPGSSEILSMSVTSKGCLLSAVLLVADLSGYVHCNENPIYSFPEKELRGLGPNFHISQDRSTYFPADRLWEYISRSQTHECGNWNWGRAIPRKGIHKWDFRCSAPYAKLGTKTLIR